jgi:hypothetical protein
VAATHILKISTLQEVLEQFRQDVTARLRADGFKLPQEADKPGNCHQALAAWIRLKHRGITKAQRRVLRSRELQQRNLEPTVQDGVDAVQFEIESGDDPTHRLTRQFFKAGFNDFLFNTFGIQHVHLGIPGVGMDKTKQHVMSGGGDALLFLMVDVSKAYLLDVLDHDVFDNAEKAKGLVQIALRNWPDLLEPYKIPGVVSSELSFEDAFKAKKFGFTTLFEVDGAFFARGNVLDGKVINGVRAACTSTEVVDATNKILNRIVQLVEFITREAPTLPGLEPGMGRHSSEIKLDVVQAGGTVIIREQNSGTKFFHDGITCGVLPA